MSNIAAADDSLTAHVAAFVVNTRYEDIPAAVMQLGKKSILDGLAVALSGSISEPSTILREYLASLGCGAGQVTVIGSAARLPPRFAALANGTAMHADDYDDTLQAETGRYQGVHPTAPVLSAVLAAAEERGASGREVLAAYQVGVEVACRVFDATHVNHILQGFHATGTCAMLGAAAAVARLGGADQELTRTILGIAASQACGLQENFGTMTKPFHAGRSAEVGVMAADLGLRGFTASPIILEAKRGFFSALGGGYEEERLRGKLGQPWSFVERGIWLKPWPSGSLGHPGMTLMLNLVTANDLKPQQVKRITARTSENIHHTLLHHRPHTELEAKFSLEFCLAALLVDRRCGLTQFTDEYVNRADVQAAIALVDYRTYSEEEGRREHCTIVTTFIDIELNDGRVLSGRADHGKGNIADPMSDAEVAAKFRECAEFRGWAPTLTEEAITLVGRLETLADVRGLMRCLHGAQ